MRSLVALKTLAPPIFLSLLPPRRVRSGGVLFWRGGGKRRSPVQTALALVPLVLGGLAAADNEPKVVTLSCDGTLTDTTRTPFPLDHQPKPIEQMGVVANLNMRTVSFMGYVAPIINVDAASCDAK